jgi:hypothetical protein
MQSAYQLQYVEFLKLREKYKQQVLELNSLRTEKTALLIKINDLEEKLLETQLQLERVSYEKLFTCSPFRSAQPTRPDSGMFLPLLLIFLLPPRLFL